MEQCSVVPSARLQTCADMVQGLGLPCHVHQNPGHDNSRSIISVPVEIIRAAEG